MYPSKNGIHDSPEMHWSNNVESVRKDIESVFGILKIIFRFLKKFINLREQSAVDDTFTTCCMLHNMMLQKDGYLEDELASSPGGLEECFEKKLVRIDEMVCMECGFEVRMTPVIASQMPMTHHHFVPFQLHAFIPKLTEKL
jgi:Plant transposon protein